MRGQDGILEVEYGEYPQRAADSNLQKALEKAFKKGKLTPTGKTYTTDSRKYNEYDQPFEAQADIEYEYNGKKYVRVVANTYYDGQYVQLSNGAKYRDDDVVFVEVEPIKWIVDEEADLAVSKNLLFAGVQFNREMNYQGNFDETDMKSFLDNCFAKDIQLSNSFLNSENYEKQNPYNFSFTDVSEEDIIKGAVESGIAVFLHGQSSEGKSARVKQLDPDCEIIYLGCATPESINGKSVYNSVTDEIIDKCPPWYKRIKEKCEKEPNKIHIVFLDELTNARASIQEMVFNIVLNREVNGIWKLPDNCRIVAAGNEVEDSTAAHKLTQPLFNRFAHVYIKTTVDSWLKWAVTPDEEYEKLDYLEERGEQKIHPAIYAYITCRGEGALRSKYTGKKPNADPRKWEMASKVLYKTNNPEMLRALVGEALTKDFIQFCSQAVISIEDVINGNYSDDIFKLNISDQYATVLNLAQVDNDNLEKVRDFVFKLGPEMGAFFDNMWSYGNYSRMEKIAQLRANCLVEGGISK